MTRPCTRCDGLGYTKDAAPVVKNRGTALNPKFVTLSMGSGCTKCKGTGKEAYAV